MEVKPFLTSSKVIKILINKEHPDLHNSLMSTLYSEPRKPSIDHFFDDSKWKHGEQIFPYCLVLKKEIDMPWLDQIFSDEEIWIEMKKTFFKS